MDELVDIVSESDEVLWQKMKSEAHEKILIHRTVHWVIINTQKQIFLTKRSLTREKWPWLYDASIGGHVLAWETYENAIIREWYEEEWIENWKYEYICKYFAKHPRMNHMCCVFSIVYDWKIDMDHREFDSGEWMNYFDIIKLPQEIFTPDYRKTLEKIKYLFLTD